MFWCLRLIALAVALCIQFSATGNAGNIVSNPDFMSGLSSWNETDWDPNGGRYIGPDGTISTMAGTGCSGAGCISVAKLYQSLSTTPGQDYTLAFDFNPGVGATTSNAELLVEWGGNTIATILGNGAGLADSWTRYVYTDLVATSSSTILLFAGRQDPTHIAITNLDVESSVPVPEPSSLTVVVGLLGVGLLANLRRRVDHRRSHRSVFKQQTW